MSITPTRRGAPRLGLAASAVLGALAFSTLAVPAAAADGPAPDSLEYDVIAKTHTDAVSTFLDDGAFTLGAKADLPEGLGTRVSPDEVWFHLDDQAQIVVDEEVDFIAPEGSTVWLAAQDSFDPDALWPGFSTQSVPAGAIDDNSTAFTLVDVEGPGELELFTVSGFGTLTRLWSTQDEQFDSFTMGRSHKHANWAFTAAGTYDITVRGDVTIGGEPQSAQATYTFIVGQLPDQVETHTTVEVSPSTIATGQTATMTASVTPADVSGYVEFLDGSTVLGHEPLSSDGSASMDYSGWSAGSRSVTARFVPEVVNLAAPSESSAATVTVTSADGEEFGIGGIADAYEVGDILEARVEGHTLAEGETYRWLWHPVGASNNYLLSGTGGREAEGLLTMPVDMSHHDYEIAVQIRKGRTTVATTPWVPLVVTSDVEPVAGSFPQEDLFMGDDILVALDGAPADGDELRLAYRFTAGSPWESAARITEVVDSTTLGLRPEWAITESAWVVQTVRDGVVVAQSEPVEKDINNREVMVEGVRSVYRAGQTLSATATVYPALEGATYKWSLFRYFDTEPWVEERPLKEGSALTDLSVEVPLEAADDGWVLSLDVYAAEDSPAGNVAVGWFSQELAVSDSDPDTQLLFFESLGGHYHQGGNIALNLVADPELADGDTISWEWLWPGGEWAPMPGTSGMSHDVVAEQALDGVQVRATLDFASGEDESLVTEPVTILVDDHGAPARQVVTVEGDLEHIEGDTVALTAAVATGTVLDTFQWFRQGPADAEAQLIEGADSAELEFAASLADDGAEYSVAVVKPDGSTAYGPSEPVTVSVDEGAAPVGEFTDVTSETSDFFAEISWLAARGISTGYDTPQGKEFRPFRAVTRDAMASFLYRYAGEPDVKLPAESPFLDVNPSSEHYTAIVWLAEEGISEGWETNGGKQFRPFAPITRDAMAAFLYRAADKPEWNDPIVSPFKDITAHNTEFYTEITWLAEAGISTGWDTSKGKQYRPFNNTTRDAMAAFLYRFAELED